MDKITFEARRRVLLAGLASGALVGVLGWQGRALAQGVGRVPRPLPDGQSVFQLSGLVTVNGKPATRDTLIGPEDTVETGDNGRIVAVVDDDAFALRGGSRLVMGVESGAKRLFRLVTGAMVSVFGHRETRELEVITPIATLGIRGTGVYTESRPDRAYLCTCYGTTELVAAADPTARETITSRHHDAPRYVLATPDADGRRIIPAPFINHTDMELMMLEALVGRNVPFGLADEDYDGPGRRRY